MPQNRMQPQAFTSATCITLRPNKQKHQLCGETDVLLNFMQALAMVTYNVGLYKYIKEKRRKKNIQLNHTISHES